MVYRGNLKGEDIAEAICNSLESIDDECQAIIDPSLNIKDKDSSSSSSIFLTLLIILICFVVLFFIMTFIYKKIVRREISQDMN